MCDQEPAVWWIISMRLERRSRTLLPSVISIVALDHPHGARPTVFRCHSKTNPPTAALSTNTPCPNAGGAIWIKIPKRRVMKDGQGADDSFAIVLRFEFVTNFQILDKLRYRC